MSHEEPRLVRRHDIIARRVAGEMLLIPGNARTIDASTRAAEMFVLNETGERLWEVLAVASSLDDLAQNLMGRFEVSEHVARRDAAVFVATLTEMGMLVQQETGDNANS